VSTGGRGLRWYFRREYVEQGFGEGGCKLQVDVSAPLFGKWTKDRTEERSCEVDIGQDRYCEIRATFLNKYQAQRSGEFRHRQVTPPQLEYFHCALCIHTSDA